ncbi:MAG: protein kinase [Acidobacteriota bacterium]
MTPERYQQIVQLYRRVVELPPETRKPFLLEACEGDEELQREVESLLDYQTSAEQFIETPALEVVAKDLAQTPALLSAGQQLKHYRIISQLGEGGMGAVFLAQDTRLGRQVAIKLLIAESAYTRYPRKRLLREAQAAAALNHPNIVTIHAIEEAEDFDFIVMEYIEGETLAAMMRAGKLDFPQLLTIGAELAQALAAAQAAGLVHRDIKPANVLIAPNGQAKLLDFGIAKTVAPINRKNPDEHTTLLQLTLEGVVVGTVAYMSPEQVRGESLDARSDIFSLGAMLYEAAVGERPFKGENAFSIMQEIVSKEPLLPSQINHTLSPIFDAIIKRALAKDRNQRFQSAAEFATALSKLKAYLEARQGGIETVEMLRLTAEREALSSDGREARVTTAAEPAFNTGNHRIKFFTRHKHFLPVIGVSLLIAATLFFFAYKYFEKRRIQHPTLPAIIETRLTNTGNLVNAAISPDGKYIAYTIMDSVQTGSLWVRQLAASSIAQIIPASETIFGGLTFSNDGNHIYYTARNKNDRLFSLYRIALLGGTPKKIKEGVDGTIAFSPDGRQFAYRRDLVAQRESRLLIANIDGSAETRIATLKSPEFFGDPAWSPDGKIIACAAGHADGGINRYVAQIQVDDWLIKPLAAKKWRWVGQLGWLADGKGLLMIAAEKSGEPVRIWQMAYPTGEARKLTSNTVDYGRLSLAAQANALLALQTKRNSHLWMASTPELEKARKMTFGAGGYRGQIRWTTDGKMVFDSDMSGTADISVMNEDGSNQRQLLGELTAQAVAVSANVTADGNYIIFAFDLTGTRHLYRMDIAGTNLTQLTNGQGEDQPHCTPDGEWVVYTDIGSGKSNLWKVSINGGDPIQLTNQVSRFPSVSPDGKLISYLTLSAASPSQWHMALLTIDGGEPVKIFPQAIHNGFPAKWTSDGRALTYIDKEQSNIWLQPVDGGSARKLTSFVNDLLFGFEWSPDGKRLACVRGIWEKDLILIKNF